MTMTKDARPENHTVSHSENTEVDCGCGERCACDPPKALLRNAFFPRKLMEVRHWQVEQAYHRRSRELVTRLGLGSGVLCGLEVDLLPTGTLVVSRGVAVDGHGRLIVVPHDVEVDPARLTDDCGRPEKEPRESGVVCVSLCYHECATDLVRMPPDGCGDEVRCVPSMVREAFAFTVTEGRCRRVRLPDGVCEELFCGHDQWARHVKGGGCDDRRRLLLDRLDPRSCACDEECVPLALVALGPERGRRLDTRVRTVIRSNRELLDLILCLADRVDECCARTPAALAPRVTALWPWPDDEGQALAEFAENRRLELAFDRDMAEQGLDDPVNWLGVWLLDPKGGAHRLDVSRAAGGLGHVGVPANGDGAAYSVDLKRQKIRPSSCVVVMARSEAVGPIRAAGSDQLALDAELVGTGLSLEQRDKLWAMAPAATEASYRTFLPDALVAPPAFLPSGDGAAGGELHVTFRPVVETVPPPRLLAVWPPGAASYDEESPDREEWKRFLERPRIELVVSRVLAEAAAASPGPWLRLYQMTQDGDFLHGLRPVTLDSGEPEDLGDGTVRITFPVNAAEDWFSRAVCLVQLRSTPPLVPESPLGRDDPQVLLDSDFAGTALDSQTLFQIWKDGAFSGGIPVLQALPSDGVQLWDGNEGGLAHWGFTVRRA